MVEYLDRWGVLDRIAHWCLILGFILGFLTGLPVFDYEVFGWAIGLVGGNEVRAFIHHWVVLALLAIAMFISFIKFLIRRKTDAFPTIKDVKDLTAITKRWFGLNVEEPELGFHHPGEKFVFLAAFISIVIFSVTGPIMLFKIGGGSIFIISQLLHSLAVMLMMIVLAGHFFMAISPSNWPVLKAMLIDGKVNAKWALKHSKKWAEEVIKVKA